MSGYAGEPEKMESQWLPMSEEEFGRNEAFLSRKLIDGDISDPTSIRRAVERLAHLSSLGSVEAAANLALYMGYDLNDEELREGIVNRNSRVDGTELRAHCCLEAIEMLDNGDVIGATALAGILGVFPPEDLLEEECINYTDKVWNTE